MYDALLQNCKRSVPGFLPMQAVFGLFSSPMQSSWCSRCRSLYSTRLHLGQHAVFRLLYWYLTGLPGFQQAPVRYPVLSSGCVGARPDLADETPAADKTAQLVGRVHSEVDSGAAGDQGNGSSFTGIHCGIREQEETRLFTIMIVMMIPTDAYAVLMMATRQTIV